MGMVLCVQSRSQTGNTFMADDKIRLRCMTSTVQFHLLTKQRTLLINLS